MYLGNQPALSYTSFAKQDFTTSATTSYTLDNPVANANEIALFINFVRQEPTTAYTASGTNLNLTSATSASDDMYCVFLGKAVQTVNPPSGSVGISQLSATGTKDSTTFLRGDNTFATAGGTNTPAFHVYESSAQTVTANTYTKVTLDEELYDTDNNFASDRFTPTTAGKYFIYGNIHLDGTSYPTYLETAIYKNGSIIARNFTGQSSGTVYGNKFISTTVDMNGSSDYVELYGKVNYASGSNYFVGGQKDKFFGGYRIIT